MRRMITVLAALCSCVLAFCQESPKEITNQFGVQAFASNTPAVKKQTIDKDESLSLFTLANYEYTLNPDKDKDYQHYQVIKLDDLNNAELLIGLITSSLERESRYVEVTPGQQTAALREILDKTADYVFVHPLHKEYFIAPDGTFRYVDGRELVGSKKVTTYLEKGKPITAATFYFALKDRGLISPDVNLRTFIYLTLDDKVKLLGLDVLASSKQL